MYINIMRGKNDATTYPETGLLGYEVASFFPLIIFILLCFNVLSTVHAKIDLQTSYIMYIYIYILFTLLSNGKNEASAHTRSLTAA